MSSPNASPSYNHELGIRSSFAGVWIDPPRTIHLRIRIASNNPPRYGIFSIVNDEEVSASHGIKTTWQNWGNGVQQIKDSASQHAQPYLQILPTKNLKPLMVVDIPCLKARYVLGSRNGLTQWFYEPIQNEDGSYENPSGKYHFEHGFFFQKLVLVEWTWFTLLGRLSLHLSERPFLCQNLQTHNHYRVYIFLALDNFVFQDNPSTHYIVFAICDNTRLEDVFEMLAGRNLKSTFSLVKLERGDDDMEALNMARIYTYYDAYCKKVTLKDIHGSSSKEILFRPVHIDFSNFGFSKVVA